MHPGIQPQVKLEKKVVDSLRFQKVHHKNCRNPRDIANDAPGSEAPKLMGNHELRIDASRKLTELTNSFNGSFLEVSSNREEWGKRVSPWNREDGGLEALRPEEGQEGRRWWSRAWVKLTPSLSASSEETVAFDVPHPTFSYVFDIGEIVCRG